MSAAEGKAAMDAHAARIAAHYDHARAKHPRFADLFYRGEKKESFKGFADYLLYKWREAVATGIERNDLDAISVLMCEMAETIHAYAHGNKAAAVEECYDAIAVLLRMVDVLEGRQALGDPNAPIDEAEKEGATK